MLDEPLTPADARILLTKILEADRVTLSDHAVDEMFADKLTHAEVFSVLRSGAVEPAEFKDSSWRYRVRGSSAYAVVVFEMRRSEWVVVVTVWRRKR